MGTAFWRSLFVRGKEMYDLCIIGAGASGMASAITAKMNNEKLRIVILEKNDEVGKKLLATGNGRCNLSNQSCPEFRETLAFFEKIGVLTKIEEGGRIYPYAEEAKEVVKAMAFQLDALGIEVKTGFEVTEVLKQGLFVIKGAKGEEVESSKLVIAAGGKAGPAYGTTGDAYSWAKKLGHKVTRLAPALSPIEVVEDFSKLKGIRQDVRLSLYKKGNMIAIEEGQLQLTDYGLSGICSFNLTRFLEVEDGEDVSEALSNYRIYVDFMPELDDEQVIEILTERQEMRGAKGLELFRSLLKEALILDIFEKAKIDPETYAEDLTRNDIEKLAFLVKNWACNVKNVKGWKDAQVTKGGVSLDEINLWTMESNLVKDLFFTGEVIDYDGPCGGYNLQNAWESAIKAGEFIAGV